MLDSPQTWRYQSAVLVGPHPNPLATDQGQVGCPSFFRVRPFCRIVLLPPMSHRGFHRVSPFAAAHPGMAEVRPAGVAQPVEHLFW